MASDINVRFAKRLRELRKLHSLTQQQLAELADIEYKHVQALESGKPPSPRLETIEKLARAFKLTCSKLLDF